MGYKGRIIAIVFTLMYITVCLVFDLINGAEIPIFKIAITTSLLIPMYFFGFQYDKAIYYSSESKDIFKNANIMIWKWDKKTKKNLVSSSCETIYGYNSQEFQQTPNLWLQLVYEKDRKIAQDFEDDSLKGKRISAQYRIVDKSGELKWIQNWANPVFDKKGKFIKIFGVTLDISKKKEADIHYKKLIDTSPVPIMIIKDKKVLYINQEGMKLIGATSLEEVLNKKLLTFLTDEQLNLSNQRLRQLYSREIDKLPFQEYKVRKIDGSFIDVESTAIIASYNDVEAILVVAKDITEEKKIKLKLKEAEEKYRSISEESLVGVYMFEDGRVTYVNKEVERILGYSRVEIEEMDLLDLFVETQHELVLNNIMQMLQSNIHSMTEELSMITKSGEIREVDIRSVVTIISNKKVIIGTITDVTNEKIAQTQLKKALKELQDIKFSLDVSAIVSITDTAGKIVYVNDKFCEVSKYNQDELIGKTHDLFIPDFNTNATIKEMRNTIQSGNVWQGEMNRRTKSGELLWFDTTIVPIFDGQNTPSHFIGIQYDITDKIHSQQEVNYLAYYDSITGLFNRNSLNKYLDDQMQSNESAFVILFVEFDRFKNITETLGYKYGDHMLLKVSEMLRECVSTLGRIFRYNGDEFVVVLSNSNAATAESLSEKIIDQFSGSILLQDVEVFTTPSIGISIYPNDGQSTENLLKAANIAMYAAKESGKSNYKFFHISIGETASKNVAIEGELRKALKENQFILYLQPKIDLRTNQIIGYELLIRWKHPTMGMIPPAEFIPIAEKTGMIVKIGEWVLEQACQKAQALSNHHKSDTPIAINISVKQFADIDFVKKSKEIIEKNRCRPSLLEFEITETVMQDLFSSIKIVKELKELGIKISMDDFGTGYSNLSILSEMELDILKIDQSFVKKLADNPKTLTLVKTIINMGHSLGFNIVAEGVETEKQLEILKQLNCDIGQGYYFSRPIPIEQIIS